MQLSYKLFCLYLLLLISFSSKAKNVYTDTTKTGTVTKYYTVNQTGDADSATYIDNSLDDFQRHLPKYTLGNAGLAIHDVNYHPLSFPVGFNYFKNNYSSYYYLPQRLKFYDTRIPYTDLFYIGGTKIELNFKMTFSYNLKKNWNVTANFYRVRSAGVYLRQNTNDNFGGLSTNYKSENNRYWLLGSIIYNSIEHAENGGIIEDSVFESGKDLSQRVLNVHLTNAKRNIENKNVYLKQIFNLGRKLTDTTRHTFVIIPESRLSLTSEYDDSYIRFQDSGDDLTSGYYSNIYYDSTQTSDLTYFRKIENELEWKRVDNQKHGGIKDLLGVGVSVKDQLVSVKQRSIDTTFNNIIAGAQLYNTYSKNNFWWNLSGNYAFTGYNKNDYQGTLIVRKKLADSLIDVSVKGEARLQTADFIYSEFRSNHFIWNNNFDKMQQTTAALCFKIRKYRLEATAAISSYKNVLYFDNYAIARQYMGTLPVFSASLKKDFSLLNWHLNNKVTYQKAPDSSVIRLPEFVLEHSLYYENNVKDILRFQIGASVYYTTAYYADAYMPVTGQFYLQNNKKYGNYPFIDFFLNARVKTVRIFFKIDHLNSGWSGNNYILTPGYPYPGRTFKFGVSWQFYN